MPQKKYAESAVKVIDVTLPSNFDSALIFISEKPILASNPSPVPIIKSEFGSILITLIPCEKSLFIGPIRLYKAFFKSISKMSPVLVPKYANLSKASMQKQLIWRLTVPKFTSVDRSLYEKILKNYFTFFCRKSTFQILMP